EGGEAQGPEEGVRRLVACPDRGAEPAHPLFPQPPRQAVHRLAREPTSALVRDDDEHPDQRHLWVRAPLPPPERADRAAVVARLEQGDRPPRRGLARADLALRGFW